MLILNSKQLGAILPKHFQPSSFLSHMQYWVWGGEVGITQADGEKAPWSVCPRGIIMTKGRIISAFGHTLSQHTRDLLKSKLRKEKSLYCPQLPPPTLKNTPDPRDTVFLRVTKL